MNKGKRKRESETENVEKKKSGEEEVEEFYAILRRIHVAVKYFEKDDAFRRRKITVDKSPWKPSFELEDFQFQGDDGVSKDGDVDFDLCKVTDHKGLGFDLNSEPNPI